LFCLVFSGVFFAHHHIASSTSASFFFYFIFFIHPSIPFLTPISILWRSACPAVFFFFFLIYIFFLEKMCSCLLTIRAGKPKTWQAGCRAFVEYLNSFFFFLPYFVFLIFFNYYISFFNCIRQFVRVLLKKKSEWWGWNRNKRRTECLLNEQNTK
jgi:hypothetical protein